MVIPIIVCGATEQIGMSVIQGLKPAIEVVFFHLASGDPQHELSSVLQGKMPANPASNIGTGDLANPPKCVVLGGAYDMGTIRSLKDRVGAVAGVRPVPWLCLDRGVSAPPLGPEYGRHVVGRVRDKVTQMEKDGLLDGSDGDVHLY